MSSIRTRFVSANDLRFEVDECGDGPRLALCLHGFPEHSYSWRYQLPLLAELGYTAWAPNLRGYGRSSRPVGIGAYQLEELVADVVGLIDAACAAGCAPAETLVLAHDWGAVIAWEFAMRQPRPLAKLVICNVPHPACARQALRNDYKLSEPRKFGLKANRYMYNGEYDRGERVIEVSAPVDSPAKRQEVAGDRHLDLGREVVAAVLVGVDVGLLVVPDAVLVGGFDPEGIVSGRQVGVGGKAAVGIGRQVNCIGGPHAGWSAIRSR